MEGIRTVQMFCAHEGNTLGMQALEILEGFGARTETLKGGDPYAPVNAVLFLDLRTGSFRSTFLRIHPEEAVFAGDIERQLFLEAHMPWTLPAQVIFINSAHAPEGRFKGKSLNGFTMALSNLVEYRDPAKAEQRKLKKLRWAKRNITKRDHPLYKEAVEVFGDYMPPH